MSFRFDIQSPPPHLKIPTDISPTESVPSLGEESAISDETDVKSPSLVHPSPLCSSPVPAGPPPTTKDDNSGNDDISKQLFQTPLPPTQRAAISRWESAVASTRWIPSSASSFSTRSEAGSSDVRSVSSRDFAVPPPSLILAADNPSPNLSSPDLSSPTTARIARSASGIAADTPVLDRSENEGDDAPTAPAGQLGATPKTTNLVQQQQQQQQQQPPASRPLGCGPAGSVAGDGAALTQKQLANFFALFDTSQAHAIQAMWPTKHQSRELVAEGTATTATDIPYTKSDDETVYTNNASPFPSSPVDGILPLGDGSYFQAKAESLEREVSALKEIIRVDSANIFQLKRSLEALKDADRHHLIELEMLTSQLRKAKEDMELLEREKEDQEGLEMQHRETINLLKTEVDRLSKSQSESSHKRKSAEVKEMNQLRFENELFAAQIVENEAEMKDVKESLRVTMEEKEELRRRLDLATRKALVESIHREELPPPEEEEEATSVGSAPGEGDDYFEDLRSKVDDLTAKLDNVEMERKSLAESYQDELRSKELEIGEIKAMVATVLRRQEESEARRQQSVEGSSFPMQQRAWARHEKDAAAAAAASGRSGLSSVDASAPRAEIDFESDLMPLFGDYFSKDKADSSSSLEPQNENVARVLQAKDMEILELKKQIATQQQQQQSAKGKGKARGPEDSSECLRMISDCFGSSSSSS